MEAFTPPPVGTIVSADITSGNADNLKDFYSSVMGWQVHPMPMGEYDDYVMMGPDGGWAGGICHLRGVNANQPADTWVVCFRVANVAESVGQAEANGGKLMGVIRDAGPGSSYAVVQDPQGGYVAIIDFPENNSTSE